MADEITWATEPLATDHRLSLSLQRYRASHEAIYNVIGIGIICPPSVSSVPTLIIPLKDE
ncbi:hypothetical protein T265_00250 [Opisthorchis viverrini]|uniref:Uncharacterized protein n=1 Tax=Opisthorchis viverrini TaxID=6198 RepID=A0A075AJW1_OPIVI|nr:hypothetical protein T265_00250 [Opisthorchis viverrini]KER34074.1 hypothetical protein T265_00250 [Opisthorchis viverrini]